MGALSVARRCVRRSAGQSLSRDAQAAQRPQHGSTGAKKERRRDRMTGHSGAVRSSHLVQWQSLGADDFKAAVVYNAFDERLHR